MVEGSDKMWSTGEEEGNGKVLQYSCPENSMNSMKRQKDRTLKVELPRSVGATGDQWANNSRNNEETCEKGAQQFDKGTNKTDRGMRPWHECECISSGWLERRLSCGR